MSLESRLKQARIGADLEAVLAAVCARLVLWMPVAIGSGIGIYFALPREPDGYWGPLVLAVGLFAVLLARQGGAALVLSLTPLAGAVGFQAALWRTAAVDAPVLHKRLGPISLEGRVLEVAAKGTGLRVVLGDLSLDRLTADPTSAKVRVTLLCPGPTLPRVGERIRFRARGLLRPARRRRLCGRRLGATGGPGGR